MYGKTTGSSLCEPENWVGQSLRESPGWGKQCDPFWWSLRYGALLPALWVEASKKEQWPLPALLSGRKQSPSSHPNARNSNSYPYVSDAFQAASLTVELRMYESELSTYVGPSRATARNPAVSVFHSVNTHWFLELGVMRTSLPGNGTLLWGPGVGLGPLPPKDIPPDFYLVWNQPILYLSLLPVLM